MSHDKFSGLAKRKLAHARELLAKEDFGHALPIILEVARTSPQEIDSTLLAVIPVLERLMASVDKHYKSKAQKFDQAWDDDAGGAAA